MASASVVVVEGDADESVVSDEMGGIQLAVSVIFIFSLFIVLSCVPKCSLFLTSNICALLFYSTYYIIKLKYKT